MTMDTKELRKRLFYRVDLTLEVQTIEELLDRLEAAENELETERMRLAACGVAALGYFDGCAKEYTSASLDHVLNLRKRLEAAEKERDALQAKIAKMEKQGPVAHVWRCDNGHVHGSCESELLMGQQLYALPGAKGEWNDDVATN